MYTDEETAAKIRKAEIQEKVKRNELRVRPIVPPPVGSGGRPMVDPLSKPERTTPRFAKEQQMADDYTRSSSSPGFATEQLRWLRENGLVD